MHLVHYEVDPRSAMTVRELADYLAKQQAKGWPGSRSITGRLVERKPAKTTA